MRLLILFFISISTVSYSQQKLAFPLLYHSEFEQVCLKDYSSSHEIFNLLLAADVKMTSVKADEAREEFDDFIAKNQKKKVSNLSDQKYLSQLFYKTHRKFLKRYVPFSMLGNTLSSGNYDCLSGTALYVLIFEELGIPYEIVETTYHLYLKVKHANGIALIESTDPLNGFITDSQKIKVRLMNYQKDKDKAVNTVSDYPNKNDEIYEFKLPVNNKLNIENLAGLQYYNLAVNAYNNHQIDVSVNCLEKASLYYSSGRIREFGALVNNNILIQDSYSIDQKNELLIRMNRLLSMQLTLVVR